MASQNLKTIMAALVTQINTEVAAFGLVVDATRTSTEYTSSHYPVCEVLEGPSTPSDLITTYQLINQMIGIRILYKAKDTNTDASRDLQEGVIDAINSDLTIGGTCRFATLGESQWEAPLDWEAMEKHERRFTFTIQYRRDFS